MDSNASRRGFTLIEIVLVLAIAGLLLIIVFLAVSGAQRARRDHQRKDDLSEFLAATVEYSGNNGQKEPTAPAQLDFIMTNFKHADPSTGVTYVADFYNAGATHNLVPPIGHIAYAERHVCAADGTPSAPDDILADPPNYGIPTLRKFAVWTTLETGGTACLTGEF